MRRDKPAVSHEIKILGNMVGRKIEHNMRLCDIDCATVMHGRIMGFLKRSGKRDVYQRDIEQEFGISRATVTNILQLMEKKGYIERLSDKSDMRLKKLRLTALGEETDKRILACLKNTDEELISDIGADELEVFYRVADKIKHNCRIGGIADSERMKNR